MEEIRWIQYIRNAEKSKRETINALNNKEEMEKVVRALTA